MFRVGVNIRWEATMTAILHATQTPAELLPSPRPVHFEQTVPRHLVHRAAVSEVFVTDMHTTGDNNFELGAQWPRRHSFLGPRTLTSHDPMLYAETSRQAALIIAHQAFDVPLSSHFLSFTKGYDITQAGLRTEGRPVDIVLTASAHEVRHGNRKLELCFARDIQASARRPFRGNAVPG
jgi:hypothetical protein